MLVILFRQQYVYVIYYGYRNVPGCRGPWIHLQLYARDTIKGLTSLECMKELGIGGKLSKAISLR